MKKIYFVLTTLCSTVIYAQSISIDHGFGNTNGLEVFPQNSSGASLVRAKFLNDGKILVSGSYISGSNPRQDFISRLLADGQIDISFGVNGYCLFNNNTGDLNGPTFFVLQNQEIVCVSNQNSVEIIKLNADGVLDSTFANNGRLIFSDQYFRSRTPILDSDENLCGIFNAGPGYGFTKINTVTGNILTTFGTNGYVALPYAPDEIYSLSNNKILSSYQENNLNKNLQRYNMDGNIDLSFGNNGTLTYYTALNTAELFNLQTEVTLDPDSNIYLVVANYETHHSILKKYEPNGNPVLSFGDSGTVILPDNSFCNSIHFKNNKIYLAGNNFISGINNLALLRYLPDGTPDTSFNFGSCIYIEANALQETAETIDVDAQDNIIAAAEYFDGATTKIFVAKYASNNLSTAKNAISRLSFKNPVKNQLEIFSDIDLTGITLYGIDGKYVKSVHGNIMQTDNLSKGFYFATVYLSGGFSENIKIVKQ